MGSGYILQDGFGVATPLPGGRGIIPHARSTPISCTLVLVIVCIRFLFQTSSHFFVCTDTAPNRLSAHHEFPMSISLCTCQVYNCGHFCPLTPKDLLSSIVLPLKVSGVRTIGHCGYHKALDGQIKVANSPTRCPHVGINMVKAAIANLSCPISFNFMQFSQSRHLVNRIFFSPHALYTMTGIIQSWWGLQSQGRGKLLGTKNWTRCPTGINDDLKHLFSVFMSKFSTLKKADIISKTITVICCFNSKNLINLEQFWLLLNEFDK